MTVHKTEVFIDDIERQFEWYVRNAGWDIAQGYLRAVEESCLLLGKHPQLGPSGGFTHPRLCEWRFFVVFRPFRRHLLFYEIVDDKVMMRRATHGHRNLPRRLLDSLE
jgi:plasmid stabilization system protein ParE